MDPFYHESAWGRASGKTLRIFPPGHDVGNTWQRIRYMTMLIKATDIISKYCIFPFVFLCVIFIKCISALFDAEVMIYQGQFILTKTSVNTVLANIKQMNHDLSCYEAYQGFYLCTSQVSQLFPLLKVDNPHPRLAFKTYFYPSPTILQVIQEHSTWMTGVQSQFVYHKHWHRGDWQLITIKLSWRGERKWRSHLCFFHLIIKQGKCRLFSTQTLLTRLQLLKKETCHLIIQRLKCLTSINVSNEIFLLCSFNVTTSHALIYN